MKKPRLEKVWTVQASSLARRSARSYTPVVPYRDPDAILKKLSRLCEKTDTAQRSASDLCKELTKQLNASQAGEAANAIASKRIARPKRRST